MGPNAFLRRLQEAKAAYQKVIEIDPRNQTALAFLGITYHLLGEIEAAIVKYHEVRPHRILCARCRL